MTKVLGILGVTGLLYALVLSSNSSADAELRVRVFLCIGIAYLSVVTSLLLGRYLLRGVRSGTLSYLDATGISFLFAMFSPIVAGTLIRIGGAISQSFGVDPFEGEYGLEALFYTAVAAAVGIGELVFSLVLVVLSPRRAGAEAAKRRTWSR